MNSQEIKIQYIHRCCSMVCVNNVHITQTIYRSVAYNIYTYKYSICSNKA